MEEIKLNDKYCPKCSSQLARVINKGSRTILIIFGLLMVLGGIGYLYNVPGDTREKLAVAVFIIIPGLALLFVKPRKIICLDCGEQYFVSEQSKSPEPYEQAVESRAQRQIEGSRKVLECKQCGGTMRRGKKIYNNLSAQAGGCVIAIIGICLLFFFPLGTIIGILLIICGGGIGYRRIKGWKCQDCGYFFET